MPPLPFKPILLNRSPATRPIQRHSTLAYLKPHQKTSQLTKKKSTMPKLLGNKYLKNSSQLQNSMQNNNKSINSLVGATPNTYNNNNKQNNSSKMMMMMMINSASNTRFQHQSSLYFNERNHSLTSSQFQAVAPQQNQQPKFIKSNNSKLKNQEFLLEDGQHYTTNYAQTSTHKNYKQKFFQQQNQKPKIERTLRLSMLLDSAANCQNQQQYQNSSIDLSDSKLKRNFSGLEIISEQNNGNNNNSTSAYGQKNGCKQQLSLLRKNIALLTGRVSPHCIEKRKLQTKKKKVPPIYGDKKPSNHNLSGNNDVGFLNSCSSIHTTPIVQKKFSSRRDDSHTFNNFRLFKPNIELNQSADFKCDGNYFQTQQQKIFGSISPRQMSLNNKSRENCYSPSASSIRVSSSSQNNKKSMSSSIQRFDFEQHEQDSKKKRQGSKDQQVIYLNQRVAELEMQLQAEEAIRNQNCIMMNKVSQFIINESGNANHNYARATTSSINKKVGSSILSTGKSCNTSKQGISQPQTQYSSEQSEYYIPQQESKCLKNRVKQQKGKKIIKNKGYSSSKLGYTLSQSDIETVKQLTSQVNQQLIGAPIQEIKERIGLQVNEYVQKAEANQKGLSHKRKNSLLASNLNNSRNHQQQINSLLTNGCDNIQKQMNKEQKNYIKSSASQKLHIQPQKKSPLNIPPLKFNINKHQQNTKKQPLISDYSYDNQNNIIEGSKTDREKKNLKKSVTSMTTNKKVQNNNTVSKPFTTTNTSKSSANSGSQTSRRIKSEQFSKVRSSFTNFTSNLYTQKMSRLNSFGTSNTTTKNSTPLPPPTLTQSEKQLYGDRAPKGYKKLKLLGKGGCAAVWLVKEENTQKTFAAKQFPIIKGKTTSAIIQSSRMQIKVGQLLNNTTNFTSAGIECISRLKDSIQGKSDKWLIYELGGMPLTKHLFDLKGQFINGQRIYNVRHQPLFQSFKKNPSIFKDFLRRSLKALLASTSRFIVHGDIKPDNILVQLQNDSIKSLRLIDFGSAYLFNDPPKSLGLGTPQYMAPQIFELQLQSAENQAYTLCQMSHPWSQDIWALGCLWLEIATGFPLWLSLKAKIQVNEEHSVLGYGFFAVAGREHSKILQKQYGLFKIGIKNCLQKCGECLPWMRKQNKLGIDLLDRMLQADPKKRISPGDALTHPFFRDGGDVIDQNKSKTSSCYGKQNYSNKKGGGMYY